MKFQIEIIETRVKKIEVEAHGPSSAIYKVLADLRNGGMPLVRGDEITFKVHLDTIE